MFSQGYSITAWADHLQVVWMSPALPAALKGSLVLLLLLFPILFFFRVRLAGFMAQHMHMPVSPRGLGIGAPLLSIAAGITLFFARPATPAIEWKFDTTGFLARSINGAVSMKWDDVASARLDERDPQQDKASLVLKSKEGKEAWLVLHWLQPQHRTQVMAFLKPLAEGRFSLPDLPPDPDNVHEGRSPPRPR